jgi:hypothetical protein
VLIYVFQGWILTISRTLSKNGLRKNKMKAPDKGIRVDVFSGDKKNHLGTGTIVSREEIVDEYGNVWSENCPKIQLDNGKEIWGFECWWHPMEKQDEST